MAEPYLVSLTGGFTRVNGVDSVVIVADNETQALAMADAMRGNDPKGIWADGSAVDLSSLVAGTSLPGLQLEINIFDGDDPALRIVAHSDSLGIFSASIDDDGSDYTNANIVTLVGGVFVKPARFALTVAESTVTAITMVDPGEYSELPEEPVAVTGGSGTGLLLDGLVSASGRLQNAMSAAVRLLNESPLIAGASMTAGTNTLTISNSGDGIGDHTVTAQFTLNGTPIPGFVGTITDEGSASAALSMTVASSPVYPVVHSKFSAR